MWSNNLRKIRNERGLSQFALAKIADVTPADISKIENGLIKPFPAWRRKLASALELSERDIFPGFKEEVK